MVLFVVFLVTFLVAVYLPAARMSEKARRLTLNVVLILDYLVLGLVSRQSAEPGEDPGSMVYQNLAIQLILIVSAKFLFGWSSKQQGR